MKENLIHARTCVYNINYHVMRLVKPRRKIITEDMEQTMKKGLWRSLMRRASQSIYSREQRAK